MLHPPPLSCLHFSVIYFALSFFLFHYSLSSFPSFLFILCLQSYLSPVIFLSPAFTSYHFLFHFSVFSLLSFSLLFPPVTSLTCRSLLPDRHHFTIFPQTLVLLSIHFFFLYSLFPSIHFFLHSFTCRPRFSLFIFHFSLSFSGLTLLVVSSLAFHFFIHLSVFFLSNHIFSFTFHFSSLFRFHFPLTPSAIIPSSSSPHRFFSVPSFSSLPPPSSSHPIFLNSSLLFENMLRGRRVRRLMLLALSYKPLQLCFRVKIEIVTSPNLSCRSLTVA